MQKLICRCDYTTDFDAPDSIDLDNGPYTIEKLANGESPSTNCSFCGTLLRAELPLKIISASKNINLIALPEPDRVSAYLGKITVEKGTEILVGYQELFERFRCLRDNLDPSFIEVMKYNLQIKAEESVAENADVNVTYSKLVNSVLEFNITGLKADQVGIIKLPIDLYNKISMDTKLLSKPPYKAIFTGNYKSIKKLRISDLN